MESNLTKYKDLTPAAQIDKKTLNKMAWRSVFLQASFNFERMQAAGWEYAMLPGLTKIHTNKEDLAASLTHNLDFFNTHPFLVTFVMGIVLSMEQQKADIPTIRAVRISAGAPLGGIGDALVWFTFVPIIAAIAANMASGGSILGAIFYFLTFNVAQFALRWWLMHWSYNLGTSAITVLTQNAKEFTHAASLLGVFVVGALTTAMGGGTAIRIIHEPLGTNANIQNVLNGILPGLIPLAFVLILYWLMKKHNFTPVKSILMLLVVGIIGCMFGIWSGNDNQGTYGGYKPLVEWYQYPEAPVPAKTGDDAYKAVEQLIDELNKAGVKVTLPEAK